MNIINKPLFKRRILTRLLMMFFKSKPHTEKLDKTLTTKLDKIFQYFKAKEEPFEWFVCQKSQGCANGNRNLLALW